MDVYVIVGILPEDFRADEWTVDEIKNVYSSLDKAIEWTKNAIDLEPGDEINIEHLDEETVRIDVEYEIDDGKCIEPYYYIVKRELG